MFDDNYAGRVLSQVNKYEEEFNQDSFCMKADKSQTCVKESVDQHTAEQLRKIKKNIKYLTDITEKGTRHSPR